MIKYTTLTLLIICIFILPLSCHADERQNGDHISQILNHTFHTNPSLLAAREELKATKERYIQAKSGWLPSLTVEASILTSNIESSNFGNGDGATTKELSLNATQPIWQGGRTFAQTARTKNLIRAGEAILDNAEQDIILETLTAYLDVMRDKKLLKLRLKNETILRKEYNAAYERRKMGDATKTDVEQAKSRMLRAESEKLNAQSNIKISISKFEQITGLPIPEKFTTPVLGFEVPQTLGEMITLAEIQNPTLHIIKFEQEAAKNNLKATLSELLPQISAFASINRQRDPQPGIVDKSSTETIDIRATLALYQGGATRSRMREARHTIKQYEYEIENTKRSVKQDVISSWHSYESARQQTQTRKSEIKAAKNVLKGVREEAKAGQRSILDILNADEDLIEAQTSFAQAERNGIVTKYKLAKTMGLLSAYKTEDETIN